MGSRDGSSDQSLWHLFTVYQLHPAKQGFCIVPLKVIKFLLSSGIAEPALGEAHWGLVTMI